MTTSVSHSFVGFKRAVSLNHGNIINNRLKTCDQQPSIGILLTWRVINSSTVWKRMLMRLKPALTKCSFLQQTLWHFNGDTRRGRDSFLLFTAAAESQTEAGDCQVTLHCAKVTLSPELWCYSSSHPLFNFLYKPKSERICNGKFPISTFCVNIWFVEILKYVLICVCNNLHVRQLVRCLLATEYIKTKLEMQS